MITLQTNFGNITIELDHENTPETAKNFLAYAEEGFYENTLFHRVINNFMIQGGGLDPELATKDTKAGIANEAKNAKPNKRGSVAMARTGDPHSATSQFFINVVDNDFLNFSAESPEGWGYCVFGEVVEGMDVVDKIKKTPTTSKRGYQDVPVDEVIIQKVIVEEKQEA